MVRKVLSLDGGGIKGIFEASFLATIEETLSCSIADYFDLIVGTSTGGIIAIGLGLGLTAREILALYGELGHDIFKNNPILGSLKWAGFSKYSQKPLKQALLKYLGDKQFGESTTRLVIPAFNIRTGDIHLYKTAHREHFSVDYKESAIDVALATSAAPSYFPTQVSSNGIPLIDGGIYANNPVHIGVMEAVTVLGWKRQNIEVLSLGCTDEPMNLSKAVSTPQGAFFWGLNIVDVFLRGQSSLALGSAKLLIGQDKIHRFSTIVPRGKFKIDSIQELDSLKSIGHMEARRALPKLKKIFFTKKARKFKPFNRIQAERKKRM